MKTVMFAVALSGAAFAQTAWTTDASLERAGAYVSYEFEGMVSRQDSLVADSIDGLWGVDYVEIATRASSPDDSASVWAYSQARYFPGGWFADDTLDASHFSETDVALGDTLKLDAPARRWIIKGGTANGDSTVVRMIIRARK
ncbi:MAG: hypothetical protein GF419_14525 [Ignavibacteriales bacterium]|nr:hypothetical protein [Ignavibacteriales bacterium]